MQIKIIGSCGRLCKPVADELERLRAENERLTNKCEDCAGCSEWKCDCFNERAEAVKEFAERLKEKRDGGTYPYVLINVIDNLVKEMTEPTKIEHSSLCETETYKG